METSAVASGSEERKNKDATKESPGEESASGRSSDSVGVACESTRGTNEENGEEEPNPQTGASEGGAEMTEGDAKDNEGEKDGSKDGGEETVKDEKEKECESSENAHREKEKTINKAEEGKAKEAKEDGNNAIAGEEGRGKAKSEEKHEKEEKIVKEEKNNDSEGPAQATADKETKAKEKVEAQTNKEKNRDKQEKTKGKNGTPPSSSSLRTSALASSRPRSARPSARREAMAKFQQDQGPAVRNFKVQKVSAGMSAGASIKQKILHWCSNKTRNYEGVSIENFSSSWSDGLAFCALVHRFFPDAFDFSTLKANEREKNFTLAFSTAESLADCCPLLDVSDMLLMGKNPDPFSVFTYVQSLCQHLSKIERDRKEREKAEEGKNQGEAEAQGKKEAEDKEQEIREGEEQGEEERETEGDPDEEKGGTEEGMKMETDQNDNVVNSEPTNET
ncbi:smoothelin-like 1 [Pygocentrus nattereri]|uniref:Calponin-homology (CH) domain-containing protein n=1 Tax=Pygocentrus nattereri TaxID=42514 RepID=A0A3B4D2J3_PYGNA|nr:smoothelin-like 1 [Pygocentrus nattereri]